MLSGHATAIVGEDEHPIGPSDFIGYRKGGLAHSIRNTGDEVLRCIVAGDRLAHDVRDYTRLGKRIYRNASITWNLVDIENVEEVGGKADVRCTH